MAISQEDIQQVLNAIKAESQGVQELETVSSLNGVNSLPGVKGNELVNVPMTLLQKPATDAAMRRPVRPRKPRTPPIPQLPRPTRLLARPSRPPHSTRTRLRPP
jgi:hypothetical protein